MAPKNWGGQHVWVSEEGRAVQGVGRGSIRKTRVTRGYRSTGQSKGNGDGKQRHVRVHGREQGQLATHVQGVQEKTLDGFEGTGG